MNPSDPIDPNRFYTDKEVKAMTPEQKAKLKWVTKAEAQSLMGTEMTRRNLVRMRRKAADRKKVKRKAASAARKANR
jgi:hypothetical protein